MSGRAGPSAAKGPGRLLNGEQHHRTAEKPESEPFTPEKTEHQCRRNEEGNERFHKSKTASPGAASAPTSRENGSVLSACTKDLHIQHERSESHPRSGESDEGEDFSVKVSVVADRNLQNIPFQLLENPSVGNAYFEKLLSRAWAYRIVDKKER